MQISPEAHRRVAMHDSVNLNRFIRRIFKSLHLAGIVTVLSFCLHTMPRSFSHYFPVCSFFVFCCSFSSSLFHRVMHAHFFKSAQNKTRSTQFSNQKKTKAGIEWKPFRESYTKSISPSQVTCAVFKLKKFSTCLLSSSVIELTYRQQEWQPKRNTIRDIPKMLSLHWTTHSL